MSDWQEWTRRTRRLRRCADRIRQLDVNRAELLTVSAEIDALARRPRIRLVSWLCLWLLERAGLHIGELCRAYGGEGATATGVRLCDRPRWHFDSHTYEEISR